MRSAVELTTVTCRKSSAGSTAAFQPAGSSCAERSPASSAAVAGWSSPTPAAHMSPCRRTSTSSVAAERSDASVGAASRLPSSRTLPRATSTRSGASARTRWPEAVAEGGMMASMLSGACSRYSAS